MQRSRTTFIGFGLAAALVAVAFAGSAAAEADLVRNGSFEAPAFHGDRTYRVFGAGEHVGPWKVTHGSVFVTLAQAPFETPPHGARAMNLTPPSTGAGAPGDGEICETVHGLVRGSAYKLRFLAATIAFDSTIDVTFGGAEVAHLTLSDRSSPANFARHAWTVTAPAHAADLCLHGDAAGARGFPIVDGVRLLPLAG